MPRHVSEGVQFDGPVSVRSTVVGSGAGEPLPRARASQPASKEDKLSRYGSPPRSLAAAGARPSSAPTQSEDAPDTIPSHDIPPNEILRRLFIRHGVRIPYQYFYRPLTLSVIPTFLLGPWRAQVDDALLLILAGCKGHTRVVTVLTLDCCPTVTDLGMSVLIPQLPRLKELDLHGCSGVGDITVSAITSRVPTDGTAHGMLLQLQSSALAAFADEDDTDELHSAQGVRLHMSSAPVPLSKHLIETCSRVFPFNRQTVKAAKLAKSVHLSMPCPSLTHLNLDGCRLVTDSSLLALCQSLSTITSLHVCDTSITDKGLRELFIKCRHLRVLRVARTSITDAAFDQLLLLGRLVPVNPLVQRKDVLASRAPRVQVTNSRGTVANDEFYQLLEDVDLSGCSRVSAAALKALVQVRRATGVFCCRASLDYPLLVCFICRCAHNSLEWISLTARTCKTTCSKRFAIAKRFGARLAQPALAACNGSILLAVVKLARTV